VVISINIGLLGFTESFNAPFVHLSIWVEAAAAVVLAATALRSIPFLSVGSHHRA
jgi:hypothetical protein